ncbi:MAG: Sialate O-acetylesterase [Fibrobacteres bacterium]|nr:Sialate O-acetylesterase [Fibrobacterota bacterium]
MKGFAMLALCAMAGQDALSATLTDELNDLSLISATSGNVGIDTANTAFFGGDPARLKRWITTAEYVTYATPGDLRSFSVQAWFASGEAGADLIFAASADDGAFTPVLPMKITGTAGNPWLQVEYALASLPPGTRFLRITFPEGGTSWAPQIGKVVLEHDPSTLILPSLFASDMVLQRGKPIRIWGKSLDGDTVSIGFRGKTVTAVSRDGNWSAEIGPLAAGGPDSLRIGSKSGGARTLRNILVGDVWLCGGQSNMWWPLKDDRDAAIEVPAAANPKIRLFSQTITAAKTPGDDVSHGTWSQCAPDAAREFSAVAYYFGKELAAARDVPIGLVQAAIGGTHIESWMSAQALRSDPDFAYAGDPAITSKWYLPELNFPSGPFNAMVRPLMPLGLTGVLWYQGENNKMDPYAYRKLLPALIRDWRGGFGQGDLPFLVVQLPAYGLDPNWPEMREAQAMAHYSLPKVGITVNIDMGDSADIHPTRKQPFGSRLARLARGMVYGEDIEYASPLFMHSALTRDSIVLEFDHVGSGLKTTDGKSPEGFEIAGADSVFYPAQATLQGLAMVRIGHSKVKNPRLFRYAWKDVPHVNLINGAHLPAGPFRSSLAASTGLEPDPTADHAVPGFDITHAASSLRLAIHAPPGRETWAQASVVDLRGNRVRRAGVMIPRSGAADLDMGTESIRTGMYVVSITVGRERVSRRIWIR